MSQEAAIAAAEISARATIRSAIVSAVVSLSVAITGVIGALWLKDKELLQFSKAQSALTNATQEFHVAANAVGRTTWDVAYEIDEHGNIKAGDKTSLLTQIRHGCSTRIAISGTDPQFPGTYYISPLLVYISEDNAYAHAEFPAFSEHVNNGIDGRAQASGKTNRLTVSTASKETASASIGDPPNTATVPRHVTWYTSCSR